MADQDRRAGLAGQHAAGCCDVVGERGQRILHDADLVAALGQFVINAAPARAICKCAMHQHDIADRSPLDVAISGIGGSGNIGDSSGSNNTADLLVMEVYLL
jgi:hypothetical protein